MEKKNEENQSSYNERLSKAVLLLLKPLVRILLRAGIGFANFAEWAKFAYIEIAEDEFALNNRSQSTSRIAILTGMHRKEVARIRNELKHDNPEFSSQPANRAERVVHAWLKEADYLDEHGAPKVIAITGSVPSFDKLAQKSSGDIHTTTVLEELLRIDAVTLVGEGEIRLNTKGYFPEAHSNEQLDIFGQSAFDLLSTLDNNIDPDSSSLKLQRSVTYHHLTPEVLEQFQQFSRLESEKFLNTLNDWLSKHDLTQEQQQKTSAHYRAGIGVYYFDERNPETAELGTGERK